MLNYMYIILNKENMNQGQKALYFSKAFSKAKYVSSMVTRFTISGVRPDTRMLNL
jgi:hypothetical protein